MEPSFYAGFNDIRYRLLAVANRVPIPDMPTPQEQSRHENEPRQNDTSWTVDSPQVWRGGLNDNTRDIRDPRMSVGWRERPAAQNETNVASSSMDQAVQRDPSEMNRDDEA